MNYKLMKSMLVVRSPSQTVQSEGRNFNSIQFINPHAVGHGASLNVSMNI